MTRLRWFLALPAMFLALSGPSIAADIRDKADMFSKAAMSKAENELDRIQREYKVPVTIETIETLDGRSIDKVLPEHAKAADAQGLYVLMARKEHKIEVYTQKDYRKHLTESRLIAIRDTFIREFRSGDFDGGLMKGIEKIDSVFSEARTEAGGSLKATATPARRQTGQVVAPAGRPAIVEKPSSGGGMSLFLIIGLGLLALFIVIRLLGALFSGGGQAGYGRPMGGGPGMGGPGYGGGGYGGGGGGGGFMSSMFGGIGGALAGNWLYDQFSGRHHDGGVGQTSSTYDAGAAPADPAADGGSEWVGPNDGGGDWGGGGGDTGGGGGDWGGGGDGGGGGDWGGGGGGDWGGGGGGGDWGGGGGDGGGW